MNGPTRDHRGLHTFCATATIAAAASLWYFGTSPADALRAVGIAVGIGVGTTLVMRHLRRARMLLILVAWAGAGAVTFRLTDTPSGEPLAALLLFMAALLWPLRWLPIPPETAPGAHGIGAPGNDPSPGLSADT